MTAIALFCNVDLSPSAKMEFTKTALSKRYRLEVFDLERLRSLLDSSLKELRRRYLGIDDEVAARLRSEVNKLLRFPDAIADQSSPSTLVETLVTDSQPRRLFELLFRYEEKDIIEVPQIGGSLHEHLMTYYRFRQEASTVETDLLSRIGPVARTQIVAGWRIYLRYVLMRFAGLPKDTIIAGGTFMNFGITWDDAERVFSQLSADTAIASRVSDLIRSHERLSQQVAALSTT